MASYWEYIWMKIKAALIVFFGISVILTGFVLLFVNGIFGFIVMIVGIALVIYAKMKMNEWFWNREESNHVYVKRGRFR